MGNAGLIDWMIILAPYILGAPVAWLVYRRIRRNAAEQWQAGNPVHNESRYVIRYPLDDSNAPLRDGVDTK